MPLLAGLILPMAAIAQAPVDRTKAAETLAYVCRQEYLSNNKEATTLVALNITVAQMCDCVALQTISKMNDEDIRRMFVSPPLPSNDAAYVTSRQFCVATFTK
jgi:hypothetical protein